MLIEGGGHSNFANGIAMFEDQFGEEDAALRISYEAQQEVTRHYVLSFLKWRMSNDIAYRDWFHTAPPPEFDVSP